MDNPYDDGNIYFAFDEPTSILQGSRLAVPWLGTLIRSAKKLKMGFLENDKPLEATKNLQKFFFVYPKDGKTFNAMLVMKHILLLIVSSLLNVIGLLGFASRCFIDNLGSECIENMDEIAVYVTFLSVSVVYAIVSRKINKLLERIQRITSEVPKELVRIHIKINRITWITYWGLMIMTAILALNNIHLNRYCDGETKEDKGYACGLLYPVWFPFQIQDTGLRKMVITFIFYAIQMCFNPFFVVNMISLISIPCFLVARMKNLRIILEGIKTSNLDEFKRNFTYYIHYYSEICGCTNDMNNSVGYACLTAYTFSSLLMAFSGYATVKTQGMNAILTFIGTLAIICILCTNGQSLEDEHEKLIRCVCSIPWYEMNAKTKLKYRLFLGMLQCPVRVKIRPLGVINHQFLLLVFQRAYSISTFLINTNKK